MDYSNLTLEDLRKLTAPGRTTYGNGSISYTPELTPEEAQRLITSGFYDNTGSDNGLLANQIPEQAHSESWQYQEQDPNNPLAGMYQTLIPNASGGFDVGAENRYDNTGNRKKWNRIRNVSLATIGALTGAAAAGLLPGTGAAAAGGGAATGMTGGAATGLGSGTFVDAATAEALGSMGSLGTGGSAMAGVSNIPGAIAGAAGAGAAGAGTAGAGTAGGSGILGGLTDAIGSKVAGMSLSELAKLGLGGAAAIAGATGGGSAPAPAGATGLSGVYADIIDRQAKANQAAIDQQVIANRPNQVGAKGETSSWEKDPVTGQWTQKVAFGAADQNKYDILNQVQSGLLEQLRNRPPTDFSQAPAGGTVTRNPADITRTLDTSKLAPMGSMDTSTLPKLGGFTPQTGAQQFGFDPTKAGATGQLNLSQVPGLKPLDLSLLKQLRGY